MKRFLQLMVSLLIFGSITVFAQPTTTSAKNNGEIVEQGECWADAFTGYEQYTGMTRGKYTRETEAAKAENFKVDYMKDFEKRIVSKEEFEKRKAFAGLECRRIKYMSDGLKVTGIIWKPKDTTGKKLPLIIYNRGGNREFGKLIFAYNYILHPFVANGFVVIGTQYRGVDGGEGKEELGGAEVNDILNLIPLAKSLGYVDMNNVFMFGESRGGMMTYLALKNKIPVNAAAVNAAPSDLILGLKNRPGFAQTYKEMMPDFDKRSDELVPERSAVYWADKINTPLLMLQGGADWRVEPI